jgi:histidinol-phosphate aminotransferase
MVAAVAALGDVDFINESRRVNDAGLVLLKSEFAKRKLETIPAFGNFITFKIDNSKAVFEGLLKQGVIVRPIAGYGLPDYLRVTVGTETQNRRFLDALDKAMAS